MIASDPLALTALQAGLVRGPRAQKAAAGTSALDAQQRAMAIGEPVPVVFCRYDEATSTGGVLISPACTEARFENGYDNEVTAYYHLVLGEGPMGAIQNRDVFQRSCRVGEFTQTYDRRAGEWEAGNVIENKSRPWRAFFTADSIPGISTGGSAVWARFSDLQTTVLTNVNQLISYPFEFATWHEAEGSTYYNSDGSSVTNWIFKINGVTQSSYTYFKPLPGVKYETPEAPTQCGTLGTYDRMATLSFQVTTPNGSDLYNRQVHAFIRNGLQVTRLVDGQTGSSNNYADLVKWALVNCNKTPADLIDNGALVATAQFLNVNGFTCDININTSGNVPEVLAKMSPYFLVAETRNQGKRGLRPLLPTNSNGTIKTGAISPAFTWTEAHITPGSFELSYLPLADRKPVCLQMTWRQQPTDDLGIVRVAEVRFNGEAELGPFEGHDMSAFCTRENHACKVGAFIRAKRAYVSHSAKVSLLPGTSTAGLVPGTVGRITLQRAASGWGTSVHDYLYEIVRVGRSLNGEIQVDLLHFPIDNQGRSLVALEVAGIQGTGILLSNTPPTVSCDVRSANDTSVPTEKYQAKPSNASAASSFSMGDPLQEAAPANPEQPPGPGVLPPWVQGPDVEAEPGYDPSALQDFMVLRIRMATDNAGGYVTPSHMIATASALPSEQEGWDMNNPALNDPVVDLNLQQWAYISRYNNGANFETWLTPQQVLTPAGWLFSYGDALWQSNKMPSDSQSTQYSSTERAYHLDIRRLKELAYQSSGRFTVDFYGVPQIYVAQPGNVNTPTQTYGFRSYLNLWNVKLAANASGFSTSTMASYASSASLPGWSGATMPQAWFDAVLKRPAVAKGAVTVPPGSRSNGSIFDGGGNWWIPAALANSTTEASLNSSTFAENIRQSLATQRICSLVIDLDNNFWRLDPAQY